VLIKMRGGVEQAEVARTNLGVANGKDLEEKGGFRAMPTPPVMDEPAPDGAVITTAARSGGDRAEPRHFGRARRDHGSLAHARHGCGGGGLTPAPRAMQGCGSGATVSAK